MHKRESLQLKQKATELFGKGMKANEIVKEIQRISPSVTKGTVYYWLRSLDPTAKAPTNPNYEKAVEMYDNGALVSEIADTLGFAVGTVYSWIRFATQSASATQSKPVETEECAVHDDMDRLAEENARLKEEIQWLRSIITALTGNEEAKAS